jgi:hypothetical protein
VSYGDWYCENPRVVEPSLTAPLLRRFCPELMKGTIRIPRGFLIPLCTSCENELPAPMPLYWLKIKFSNTISLET